MDTTQRYERGERLGGGAMGEVWRVRDRATGGDVAMKTLHWTLGPESEHGAAARRFEREVTLQAHVRHRSVPRVLDRGHDADGTPWFTMERVDGHTLAALLEEQRARRAQGIATLDVALLRVFVRLCRVVAHAHARGVVHRDLKPENVMIDAAGEVHVIDWGLAGLVGEAPDGPRGVVLGTPGYIAPEHARGEGRPAHPTGDVFALGALLFEIVHLEPLYPQRHPLARITATLLEGDPLSGRCSSAPELESAIRCAIAREPSARFDTAEALALAVELAVARRSRPAVCRPVTLGIAAAAAAAAIGMASLSPVLSHAGEKILVTARASLVPAAAHEAPRTPGSRPS